MNDKYMTSLLACSIFPGVYKKLYLNKIRKRFWYLLDLNKESAVITVSYSNYI